MPTYCEKCPKCGHKQEHICVIENCDKRVKCDRCGEWMQRDYQAEQVRVGNKEYNKPIHSDSLAIMPSQRKEHEKLFPNIKLDNENRPVFTNFKDHNDYLERTGFIKQRQKIKRKATRIV